MKFYNFLFVERCVSRHTMRNSKFNSEIEIKILNLLLFIRGKGMHKYRDEVCVNMYVIPMSHD